MSSAQSLSLDYERSVWRILADTLRLYGRYPWLFLVLAAPIVAVRDLGILAVLGEGPLARTSHTDFGEFMLVNLVDLSVVGPLISALHTHAVVLAGEGAAPRFSVVARRGLRVLPVVAAATIMAGLFVGIGLIFLVIPGILIWLRLAVAAQVAAVENESWKPALSRSEDLTMGNYRRIFGLLLVGALAVLAVRFPLARIPLGGSTGPISVTLGIAIDTASHSLFALAYALLYFDLRTRENATAADRAPGYEELPDSD